MVIQKRNVRAEEAIKIDATAYIMHMSGSSLRTLVFVLILFFWGGPYGPDHLPRHIYTAGTCAFPRAQKALKARTSKIHLSTHPVFNFDLHKGISLLKSFSFHLLILVGDGKIIFYFIFTHTFTQDTHCKTPLFLLETFQYDRQDLQTQLLVNHRRTQTHKHTHTNTHTPQTTHKHSFLCSFNRHTCPQLHNQAPNHSSVQTLLSLIQFLVLLILLSLIPVDCPGGKHLCKRRAILQVVHNPENIEKGGNKRGGGG